MRRSLLVSALLALTLAPSAGAGVLERYLSAETETVALVDGRGRAVFASRDGAILGTLERGRLITADLPRGEETTIEVSGCETRKRLDRRRRLCVGKEISFSIVGGWWRAVIQGTGINASAVLRGSLRLKGRAGTYAIAGAKPRRWPRKPRTFPLGT